MNVECQMPNVKCQIPCIKFQVSNVNNQVVTCQLSSIKHQMANVMVSKIWIRYENNFTCQVSNVNYQAFHGQLSSIKHQMANIKYQNFKCQNMNPLLIPVWSNVTAVLLDQKYCCSTKTATAVLHYGLRQYCTLLMKYWTGLLTQQYCCTL